MYAKKFIKTVAVALAAFFFILMGGMASLAGAFSVDVDNLTYSDDSDRWVEYDFANGTVGSLPPNAIMLDGVATMVKPTGETDSVYFWGAAPIAGLPSVNVTKNAGSATIVPSGSKGGAVLFAGAAPPATAPSYPTQTLPTQWFHTVQLGNFTGIEDQKAYRFSIGLGRDETAGPFNNASIQVLWVKGYYDGAMYDVRTLIVQARVQNSDNTLWQSLPIVRTDVDPATAALIFDLGVENGNFFTAAVKINDEDTRNLGDEDGNGCTLTTEQGSFLRFPDLYPYIYMEEENASTAPQATVQSQHWKDSSGNDAYHAGLYVADPLHLASAIQVTGYNGANVSLYYDVNAKSWYNATPVVIGNLPVVSPSWPSYTFSFTQQTGGAAIPSVEKTITGYVTEFATDLLPSGSIATTPTFSWTAAAGTISGYGIELSDVSTGNRVWSLYGIPPTQTSVPYVGPALETGKTYRYNVNTQIEQGESWNASFAQGSFTWTGATQTTISFTGNVMTAPNWPVIDGMLPFLGATVAAQEAVVPLEYGYSYGQVITNEAGAFSIGGIPASTTFRLTIPTPASTTYASVLSKFMNWNADIQGLLPFVLFTQEQYNAFGNTTGNGMILGSVALQSNPASFLAGATITAREMIPGETITYGATYPVSYTGDGYSTGTDGIYMVKNVPAGKIVQLQATLSGYTFMFNGPVVPVAAGSISEDSFFATPVSGSGGTFAGEDAFTTVFPDATLIDFNAINTSSGHAFFAGNEYAYQGIVFSSPNSQTLYVEPPPISNWVWTSNYLSAGAAPFEGGDATEDSLTVTFSVPVSAVGWKFLEIPNFSAIDIRLYDASNNLIHESLDGAGMVASATSDSAFWGYASATPIARVEITDMANNGDDVGFDDFRFAAATTPPAGISFSGILADANNNPIGGATIEKAGNASINATTDTTTGAFVLNGLPAGELFSVRMSPPTTLMGLVPTFTQAIQSTTPITAARTYNLYAATDLTAWGTATGTGVIRGRVMNSANLGAGYVSGAVVSYGSSLGNAGYRVMYEDIYGNLVSGGGTFPNGKFFILDVAQNDMVTVSAVQSNYSIFPTAFGHEGARTQADSVYQGLVKGPTVSGRVGIGGYIKNTANPQVGIKNVVVGQVGVTSPVNATMSNGDGFFYLNLPQATPVQVKFEKPQDASLAPTYTANMTFGAENLAIGDFNLFTKTTLAGWTADGKGIIRSRVKDTAGNYLAGATVTATSALHPETGTPYQICYDDACSTTATDAATGRYIVKNVDYGDTVTVTARKDGYSFNIRTFPTHSGSMHQGSITGTVAVNNLIVNGSFNGNLNGWFVNPALQTDTPPWTPLLADGSGVSLHPAIYSFNGMILYQNLNLTNVADKTLSLSIKLSNPNAYAYTTGNTVAVWLTYVDGSGSLVRTKELNPANSSITAGTVVTGSFDVPTGVQKIVKIELVKENSGDFNADDVVLWADGITVGATPVLSSLSTASGAYGSTLTITGSGFGTITGKVTIGGMAAVVASWSDTSITVSVASPARSGHVVVIAGGVESNPSQPIFTVTSPHFVTTLLAPEVKVIRGQTAEFLIATSFYNGFTTTDGITLQLQGGDAATLSGKTTFIPVPIKTPGGVVLKIDTTGLDAGTYAADVLAVNGSENVPVGTLKLQVVTVSNIKFYEMVSQAYPNPSIRDDLTFKTVTAQGQFYIYTEVTGSDDLIIPDSMVGPGAGVVLTEVPASAGAQLLGIYKRFWGYELYAHANGTTTLRATAPDGTTADLRVTVNFPITTGSSYVTSIGLAPAEGTEPFVSAPTPTVPNNRTGAITFTTTATTSLGLFGVDTSGMMNPGINDFLYKLDRSTDNLSAVSTFTLQNTPTDLGTAVLYASTSDNGAKAAVPLTTVNAPGTGLLALGIRSLDPSVYAGMFQVLFYGATDNLFKFERNVYAMYIGNRPVPVGNIPPGEYRLLFAPENTFVKPQWWPNASVISDALPVIFTADATTADIFFFGAPQPEAPTGPALAEHGHDFTTNTAQEGSVSVAAAPGYVWRGQSDAPWITIASGATGSGDGTVNYQVAANPYGMMRTGTITIGGQTYTITQAGSGEVPRHVGTWGVRQLIHFDDDDDNLDGDGVPVPVPVPVPWYAEVSKTTLNEDGTGTMMMKKNDHNGELKQQMASFTYSMSPNADGSLTMEITMTPDGEIPTENVRMVISDDGQTALVDGTGNQHQQKLMILCRLHENAVYGNQTLQGDYYFAGFERNATSVVDPPNGNGAYMTIAGIQTFDGDGHYDYFGWANSVKTDRTNVLWKDPGKTNQPYTVNDDGTISVGNGAFIGAVAPTGLIGGINGTFVNGVNNQSAYFYMKRGDRIYKTSDIAGTWALAAFGQDSKTTDPARERFYSSIGTMVCDRVGNCKASVKNRLSCNAISTKVAELAVTIAPDGSFGSFSGDQPPAFAGAIGNNGNTVCFIPGLNYPEGEDPWNREIVVAIRASGVGYLDFGDVFYKGDVNGDGRIGMDDAALTLQVMAGQHPEGVRADYTVSGTDVNGDGYPGQHELLYILQKLGGFRGPQQFDK